MITIDRREKRTEARNADLLPLFLKSGVPHEVKELEFGDFSFEGNGPHGPCLVGIERKSPQDLMRCMVDGRFVGQQLPGMMQYYDYCYLVVEGITRPDPESGILQWGQEDRSGRMWWRDLVVFKSKRFFWRDFDNFITTLEHSRLKVRPTDSAALSVARICSLYHWFTHKRWCDHESLRQLYTQPYEAMTLEDKSSIVRRLAKELDGIGIERSLSVHMKFHTPFDMFTAERSEWESIPGIGKGVSEKIWRQIHGRETDDTNTDDTQNG